MDSTSSKKEWNMDTQSRVAMRALYRKKSTEACFVQSNLIRRGNVIPAKGLFLSQDCRCSSVSASEKMEFDEKEDDSNWSKPWRPSLSRSCTRIEAPVFWWRWRNVMVNKHYPRKGTIKVEDDRRRATTYSTYARQTSTMSCPAYGSLAKRNGYITFEGWDTVG